MSDQQQSNNNQSSINDLTDPTKNSKCLENCEAIRAPHIPDGHTFLVRTIINSTTITERQTVEQTIHNDEQQVIQQNNCSSNITIEEEPSCSSKAIVPISSSLPSKLLRFHAKRSAHDQNNQSESIDSQFSSDEGVTTNIDHTDNSSDDMTNDCADIFDSTIPTAPAMSPVPNLPPLSLPNVSSEERLIDVGMGSSIEGSEESEEDDELKPLAIDNHVLHNVELSSPISEHLQTVVSHDQPKPEHNNSSTAPAVLSEANLEKFRKHNHHHNQLHHNMDNIYLHPNFKHEYSENNSSECSPPPAVAPANSPVEQRRAHRSFLTMKKPTQYETNEVPEPITNANANLNVNVNAYTTQSMHAGVVGNVVAAATTTATASTNTDPNDLEDNTGINEVDTLDAALIPNDELAAEIAEAVEFYFSNESILKDAFLLKHVRRNKEGFVSLKLVSSFKRVRQLTRDWRVVGWAVRQKSRKIELNDLGSKVRRIEPLPTFDETMPSRTIVACDLPLDKLTIEKVSDIFSKCGEIALIRILKPGMAIPVDVRQFMNKYPEMMQKECALVEYIESSSAREARNLEGPFQVYEMVAPKKKTGKKAIIQVAAPIARMVENYRYYNDASYERTRGGSFSGVSHSQDIGDLRYKLKRNNSDFHPRNYSDVQHHHSHQHQQQYNQPHQQSHHYNNNNNHHHHYQSQHHHHASNNNNSNNNHRGSFGEHTHPFQHYHPRGSNGHDAIQDQSNSPSGNFFAYSPRRYSNTSTISANTAAALNDTQPSSITATQSATQTSNCNINGNGNGTGTGNGNASNNSVGNGSYAHVAGGQNPTRRLSNCSDGYSNFSEMSRRASNCSDHVPQRRDSNCSENCPCSRRVSDFGQTESYRKNSQCSIGSNNGDRRYSNGSLQFERTFSSNNNNGGGGGGDGFMRRMSNDFNYERKASLEPQTNYDDGNVGGGGGGYNVFPRRYSNNFNVSNKLAAYDNAQYINGRRISTDSGYDRRCSFGSEYEGSPRSRTGSFLNNYKHGIDIIDGQPRSRTNSFLDNSPRSRSGSLAMRNAENLVRTPLGPDGSKGFGSRTRKLGQTVSPVN